jgi:hypothetical protein
LHLTIIGIESTINAGLPGEPKPASSIEGEGIEIGISSLFRQRPDLYRLRLRFDADDRVQPAICDVGGTVGSNDHAVRCGALTEWDPLDLARCGIEPAEDTGMLAGVPNGAVRCGRNIVRMIIRRDRVVVDFCRGGFAGT